MSGIHLVSLCPRLTWRSLTWLPIAITTAKLFVLFLCAQIIALGGQMRHDGSRGQRSNYLTSQQQHAAGRRAGATGGRQCMCQCLAIQMGQTETDACGPRADPMELCRDICDSFDTG